MAPAPATDLDPWSKTEPYQLRFWDQTAWATLVHCPRHYWLAQVKGYRKIGSSIHLDFGSLVHGSADIYQKALHAGGTTEDATVLALQYALETAWPEGQERDVFGGFYGLVFQCPDRTKTVTKKGIKRCPWSYKCHLVPASAEVVDGKLACVGCGMECTAGIAYLCEEKVKNLRGLARTVVALCDHFTKSGLRPIKLSDGRVGSEYRWFRELDLISPDGTPYVMTGSFDRLAREGTEGPMVINEFKTTLKDPNEGYYAALEGGPQVFTYTWAARGEFPEERAKVVITPIHVGSNFCEVYQRTATISKSQLAEFEKDLGFWISLGADLARAARTLAEQGQDPAEAYRMNPTACNGVPGAPTVPCPFRDICRRTSPIDRERFLAANYKVEHWNPLGTKGSE